MQEIQLEKACRSPMSGATTTIASTQTLPSPSADTQPKRENTREANVRKPHTKKTPKHTQQRTRNKLAVKQSGVKGVRWATTSQGWIAGLRTEGKLRSHFFGVRKYGASEALRLAIECRMFLEKQFKPPMEHANASPAFRRFRTHYLKN
eukprot:GHVT01100256.1.p1 GENE.GHVT01100256.1~~GHVT01100256.1.p1  ORF type:complete len:149 (+),score=10.79 GHVT01100256.1:564-1010(+)